VAFVWLGAVFVTCLVIADIIGSKLISFNLPFSLPWLDPHVILSAGIVPFPVTFVLTDSINEFYGTQGAKRITIIGLAMAILSFCILTLARWMPTFAQSPIPNDVFNLVFGLSGVMFVASLTAYLLGQFLDIAIFHGIRRITGHKWLWLRSTGSTVVSQLVDTLVVTLIAFGGKLPWDTLVHLAGNNYFWKFCIAVAMTPVCYLLHGLIHRYLGNEDPERQAPNA
jgi:queuosine precursor transporter